MQTRHAWLKKIAVAPPAYQGTLRHDRLASAMPDRRRPVKARAARARLRRLAALTGLRRPGFLLPSVHGFPRAIIAPVAIQVEATA